MEMTNDQITNKEIKKMRYESTLPKLTPLKLHLNEHPIPEGTKVA